VGEAQAEAAIARLYESYRKDLAELGPFPGVRELLADLKRSRRHLALFTGRGRPSTEILLETHALTGAFDLVVTSDDVPAPKPAPDGLQEVLRHFGETADQGAYIGDTIKDIEAARGAGMLAVAAVWGSPEPEKLRGAADLVLETVAEAAAMLGV
jgi:AHBA synthesis associated protein